MDVQGYSEPRIKVVGEVSYRIEAVTLVKKGYGSIMDNLQTLRTHGQVPRNEGLRVVIVDRLWSLPPLLSAAELHDFQVYLGFSDVETVVKAIWHILENECHERAVVPAITIAPESGEMIVILHA